MAKQKTKSSGMGKYLGTISKKENASGVEQVEKNLKRKDQWGDVADDYIPVKPLLDTFPQEGYKKDAKGGLIWNNEKRELEKEKFIPVIRPERTEKKKKLDLSKGKLK